MLLHLQQTSPVPTVQEQSEPMVVMFMHVQDQQIVKQTLKARGYLLGLGNQMHLIINHVEIQAAYALVAQTI